MKKALLYSASALAMFGFASCSNDLNEPNAVPDGTEVAVSLTSTSQATSAPAP